MTTTPSGPTTAHRSHGSSHCNDNDAPTTVNQKRQRIELRSPTATDSTQRNEPLQSIVDPTVRYVLDSETSEKNWQKRREAANKKLLHQEIHESSWNIHTFKAHITILLREEYVDINTQYRWGGGTLLSRLCKSRNMMSHTDQQDAIMFLLENGADPNRGEVLRWIIKCYYQNKYTDSEFVGIFSRIIQDYSANVNYRDEQSGPFMLQPIHDYFYYGDDDDIDDENDGEGELKRKHISELQLWSDHCQIAISSFVQYGGDVNVQDITNHHTLLSLLCNIASDIKRYHSNNNEAFQSIVCSMTSSLLLHGADVDKGFDAITGLKAIHYACYTGYTPLVQLLLENHRNTGTTTIDCMIRSIKKTRYGNSNTTTAFHEITEDVEQFIPIAKMLVKYGATINSQDDYGNTILHIIVSYRYELNRGKIAQFLVNDCQADFLTIKNKKGKTVWDISRLNSNRFYCRMMEQKRRQQVYASLILLMHQKLLTTTAK
jgi:ankyrin repeat protein